ncbi:hypothetical protein PP175_28800 (plasmid) [Aneurinibacillus sp. Ricciae_BoGa-3]|uniref:hypothetical protein n=1 Tax=Aneurinibacillus sp. Ricciae_BoGa-3 TaxID=3022697 RepID=UPI002342331E|nr:hypothetical protein [Aneurinibacillus sp. Ricciae_BoGa-3]WCK57190.1 hypothetical protein PP175_28800 [Aneurinibacillus sp. Ricciae_BoGa-3]
MFQTTEQERIHMKNYAQFGHYELSGMYNDRVVRLLDDFETLQQENERLKKLVGEMAKQKGATV